MLRFGIMVMPQHPRSDSASERFRETVALTRLARDAGLDSIACGQHYLSPPYQSLQSIPLLARLAADSGAMDVILAVLLLPLLSPVQVAEDVATLDVVTGGRVVLGVGLGYRDVEYEAFNTSRRARAGRLLESLALIHRLWKEEHVSFAGRHFRLTDATCTIRPLQSPPRIWIAANDDRAVLRAGRLGYPWFLNPHATLATLERQMQLYRAALREAGHAGPATVPILKELHVAATREEALAGARPYLEPKYRAYADWGQDKALAGEESFRIPFERLAADRFILGSVDDVIQQIDDHHRRLGADHFVFRIWWPGMAAHHAYRVVETLGARVIPHFRRHAGEA